MYYVSQITLFSVSVHSSPREKDTDDLVNELSDVDEKAKFL